MPPVFWVIVNSLTGALNLFLLFSSGAVKITIAFNIYVSVNLTAMILYVTNLFYLRYLLYTNSFVI